MRECLSPGGLRGLQIRREASEMSLVGSTPIRSRHIFKYITATSIRRESIAPGKTPASYRIV
jgi:hypothetical protein